MFENNFTRWHAIVALALWLAFAALTLAFSLSLMPLCLGALAVATAVQVVWLPEAPWWRAARLATWAAGLLMWFGGGILSFSHALG